MYIIRGKMMSWSPFTNRFYWWIDGWVQLIDGIVQILTFGFISSQLSEKLALWRLKDNVLCK